MRRARSTSTDNTFASFRKLTDTNPQAANFALGDNRGRHLEEHAMDWRSRACCSSPSATTAGQTLPDCWSSRMAVRQAPIVNNYRVGGLEGGQLWAGQGWAVFYPNPRGSTNYGEKFLRANVNDWGGGDYRDIMTGVDALVARGIADPESWRTSAGATAAT